MSNKSDGTAGSQDLARRATAAVEGRTVNRLLQSQRLFEGLRLELVRITQSTHSAFLEYKSPSKDFGAPLLVKYIMISSGPQKAAECVSREFKAIETVRRLVGNDLGESIPSPLLVLPEAGLMVMKKLPGVAVSRILQRNARWIFAAFRTVKLREIASSIGSWLKQFHQATRQPHILFDAGAFEQEVRQQVEGCVPKGLSAASAQDVLRVAAKGSQQAAGRPLAAACRHGDFTVRNLLLDGQQIRVLDFESFAEHDTVYEDLGKFVAYLTLLRGRPGYSRNTLSAFQQSFLEGYGDSIDPHLVRLFTLKAATRMMAHRGIRRISSFLGLDTLYSRQFLRFCASTDVELDGHGSQPTRGGSLSNESEHKSGSQFQVVEYGVGQPGYQDAANYDRRRFGNPASNYKQTVMMNAITRLAGPLDGKSVLDVGCGTGRGVVQFAQRASFVAGCDYSFDMLSRAAEKTENSHCRFVRAVAQQLPFADASFDIVTALNFLHLFGVETQRSMIAEMKRVVKPGGIIVLEFDNALHGLVAGLCKRWFGNEPGSLPWEIRRAIGENCRIVGTSGAVFPIAWRAMYRFPRLFIPFERLGYLPPFNHLLHRIYYKVITDGFS